MKKYGILVDTVEMAHSYRHGVGCCGYGLHCGLPQGIMLLTVPTNGDGRGAPRPCGGFRCVVFGSWGPAVK
jgi:hypothetical protein